MAKIEINEPKPGQLYVLNEKGLSLFLGYKNDIFKCLCAKHVYYEFVNMKDGEKILFFPNEVKPIPDCLQILKKVIYGKEI